MSRAKVIAYADFETEHQGDLAARGEYVGVVGATLHVFTDDKLTQDTHRIPESRVKCACAVVGDTEVREHSVQDFLMQLYKEKTDVCYFHNLAFDEYYMTSVLLENGNKLWLAPNLYVTCRGRSIGYQGAMYSAKYAFMSNKDKQKKVIVFRDSAKVWAQPLRKLGDMVGVKKGDEALRVGCDKVLEDYCIQDCYVLKAVMEEYFKMVEEATEGRHKGWSTAAATAYNMGIDWLMNRGGLNKKEVEGLFPPCNEEHGFPDWFRANYKGATPLLYDRIRGTILNGVSVFDINSDYPYQMVNMKLPVGTPQPITEEQLWHLEEKGELWVARVKLRMHVKEGHRATFLLKHKDATGSTLAKSIDTDDPEQDPWQAINSVDFKLIERDYDIEYMEVIEAYGFVSRVGIFKDFLMYWYDVKSENKHVPGKEALVAFAKLIINSFYGKFGSNPVFEEHEYLMGDDGVVKLVGCEDVTVDERPKYLPFAMFVTSYARNLISEVCNLVGWENVAYTDTDSIHVFNKPGQQVRQELLDAGYICDGKTLGGWDLEEEDCPMALYLRPKGYVHANADGTVYQVKMAGANEFGKMNTIYDFMKKDAVAYQKRAYKVIGGKLLCDKATELDKEECIKTRLRIRNGHTIEGLDNIKAYMLATVKSVASAVPEEQGEQWPSSA